MNILAIDTSTKYFCLVIAKDKDILVQYHEPLGRELSRLIIPTIKKCLKKSRLALKDIDCFAVGLGPGSFTGLRIGLATIKGFALALKKPVIGLSSLDTMAYSVNGEDKDICPVVDAKRALVYSAIYRKQGVILRRKSRYLLVGINELLDKIKKETVFLGDAVALYRAEIANRFKQKPCFKEEDYWYPCPEFLLALALEKIKKKEFKDAGKIVPLYLYPKDCQVVNR